MASLKPIIDEELGMLSELASVEDVMQKLGNVTTNPDEVNLHCILSKNRTHWIGQWGAPEGQM